jgi:two-component sensor histidine kinase
MTSIDDLYRLLRAGHAQAQAIVDTVADPMLVLDGNLCIEAASRSFFETFGGDRYDTIGKRLYELGDGQWDIPELRRLLLEVLPKSTAVIDFKVEHDFPRLGRRTMLVSARTLFHPDNATHSMLLSIVDVTERVRRDAATALLFGELRHRMKNLLAVTRSIAGLTRTAGRSAEEYREAFLGRFNALVDAQDLAFADQDPGGSRLAELIERILAPYSAAPDAVAVEPGPAVELEPRTISALGLVLHELATNAAKHGALSTPGGRVRVGWEVEDGRRLRLGWRESGGPPVTAPAATGYGSELVRGLTTYDLGGELEQRYAAGGLEVDIVIPLDPAPPSP